MFLYGFVRDNRWDRLRRNSSRANKTREERWKYRLREEGELVYVARSGEPRGYSENNLTTNMDILRSYLDGFVP